MMNGCIHRRMLRARVGALNQREPTPAPAGAERSGGWGEGDDEPLDYGDDAGSSAFEDASSNEGRDEDADSEDSGALERSVLAALHGSSSKDAGDAPEAAEAEVVDDDDQEEDGATASLTLVLLRTGAPLRIPAVQAGALWTEDMTARQQEAWVRLGTSDEAAAMRQRLQSAALASDMSAFKAANNGAILEDFVRWHSPRDWTAAVSCAAGCAEMGAATGTSGGASGGADGRASGPADGTAGGSQEEKGAGSARPGDGVLSARMMQGGDSNLWRATWRRAKAQPASMQAPLFDAAAEGGKALKDLASVATLDLVVQMTEASLGAFFDLLESSARTSATAALHGAAAGAESTPRCDVTEPGERPLCAVQKTRGATAHVLGVSLVTVSRAMQRASKLLDTLLTVAADGATDGRRAEDRAAVASLSETTAGVGVGARGGASERDFEALLAAAERASKACDAVRTAMGAGERLIARVDALQAQLVKQDRLIAALASAAEPAAGAAEVSRASPTSAMERAAAVRCLKLTPALATPSTAEFIVRHHAGGDGAVSRMYARVVGSELRLATALSERVRS